MVDEKLRRRRVVGSPLTSAISKMTSQISTGNDRLSFDILGIVFYYYSTQESLSCPLETLLQVCHSWREAALGHRSIWGRIEIVLQPEIPFQFHKFHILSRLDRSGPFVPLDIDIELPCNNGGTCGRCARATGRLDPHTCQLSILADILNLLAGPDGDRCKRWRTLHLQLEWYPYLFEEEEEPHYIKGLTYPMPALEELYLNDFAAFGQVFPSCPRLETIHFERTYLNTPMDISNAQHVVYASDWPYMSYDNPTDLSAAERLKTFRLNIGEERRPISLPQSLPFLTSLTVECFLPSPFHCPTMPSLTHLNISALPWIAKNIMTMLCGIKFSQLQVLEIQWPFASYERSEWSYGDLIGLLTHLDNDILLKVSPFIFTLLLKFKWDTTKADLENDQHILGVPFFRHGNLNVSIKGEEGSILFSKDDSLEALMEMAQRRDLPTPDHSLDDLLLRYSRISRISYSP